MAFFRGNLRLLLLLTVLRAGPQYGWCEQARESPGTGRGGVRASRQAAGGDGLSAAERESFRRAVGSYETGDLAAARGPLVTLAAEHPRAGEVQTAAGMVLAESGEVVAAVPYLERARRLLPGKAEVAANLGVAYLKLGRAADAVHELEVAARLEATNARTAWSLGQARLQAGDSAGAERAFATVKRLDPGGQVVTRGELVYGEALARWNRGDGAGAAALLNAEAATGSSADAQELLGEMDERAGQYESAVGHFTAAAKLEPSEANTYALGVELLRHWTFAPAVTVLRFGAERYPESRRLQLALGIAYYGGSEFGKAAPVFRGMLRTAPDDVAAADLLGRSCSAEGAGAAAADVCGDLPAFARAHPANAPAALYAAIAILHQPEAERDTAAAELLLRSALRADASLAQARYELGALEQGRSAWAASAVELERAVALRPGYSEAHYRLSRAYAHLGRPEEARREIALQQRSSEEEKAALNRRLGEVITFLPGRP